MKDDKRSRIQIYFIERLAEKVFGKRRTQIISKSPPYVRIIPKNPLYYARVQITFKSSIQQVTIPRILLTFGTLLFEIVETCVRCADRIVTTSINTRGAQWEISPAVTPMDRDNYDRISNSSSIEVTTMFVFALNALCFVTPHPSLPTPFSHGLLLH